MTPDLIAKNIAPDPTLSPKSKTELLSEVPEESVWLANFISSNTKRNYLFAVREFITFHKTTSATAGKLVETCESFDIAVIQSLTISATYI